MKNLVYEYFSLESVVFFVAFVLVLKTLFDIKDAINSRRRTEQLFERVHGHMQALEHNLVLEVKFLKDRVGIVEDQLSRIEPKINAFRLRDEFSRYD